MDKEIYCYPNRQIVKPAFSIDLKSPFKHIWFFWWLIVWSYDYGRLEDFSIGFYLRGEE